MKHQEAAPRQGQSGQAGGSQSPGQLNRKQIELHLKSAVDALIPDVLSRIDLTLPQEIPPEHSPHRWVTGAEQGGMSGKVRYLSGRLKRAAVLTAACLCLITAGSGVNLYQNRQIESVIGIDVNPSVELSVNRRDRVLKADALNEDAQEILAGLDLKGVELNTAVNAVIGSMVSQGYLDDLDNAILVTVSNDSISKATELRSAVVGDIQKSLQDNAVEAVVYDQQVIEDNEIKALAGEYNISYGKAYFLSEVVRVTPELDERDLERLASMSIEQIAGEITDISLVTGDVPKMPESIAVTIDAETSLSQESESSLEESTQDTAAALAGAAESSPTGSSAAVSSALETTTVADTESEETFSQEIEVDYVDVNGKQIDIYFVRKVRWKNPTISVRDQDGQRYSAMITGTSSSSCEIEVSGIPGGRQCEFTINGIYRGTGGPARAITGTFTMPVVSEAATESNGETVPTEDSDDEEETSTSPETSTSADDVTETEPASAQSTLPAETSEPVTASGEKESSGGDESLESTSEGSEQASDAGSGENPENSEAG